MATSPYREAILKSLQSNTGNVLTTELVNGLFLKINALVAQEIEALPHKPDALPVTEGTPST